MHPYYSNVQYKSYCIIKYKKKTVTKQWSNPIVIAVTSLWQKLFGLADDMSIEA